MSATASSAPTPPPASRGRPGLWLSLGTVAALAVLLAIGIVPRLARQRELRAESERATAVPLVTVAPAHRAERSAALALPATIQGVREAALHARANGYVKRWLVDMGGHVAAGQLLAEIETPELDQELDQARASLTQVQATLALTRSTLARWTELVKEDAATKQELDEKRAAYDVATANARVATANVQRLTALKSFARVVAPFAGVVTARNVEVGSLVTASVGAGSRPLFTLAGTDSVRLLVNVPQSAVAGVRPGQEAEVRVQDLAAGVFHGRVARTANALDPSTRTLPTEIRLANPGLVLLPGMYAQVALAETRAEPALLVPANTLVMRPDGAQVAEVVGGRVRMRTITLGRDYGTEVEALRGVADGAKLVVNPGDEIADGVRVRVAAGKK